ncbi:HAMP domain-containing sensor histidine kinase [Lentzea sp. DG1S-22]|uniref:sensor histidine kinase n=1 Tax=Lentzea sp. DG1S-22 TaxID=3108822 RepID=UPI002E7665F9|nr:HAMP domain-containing sensor histidine kinase [Lentzea sp. DG1S-22]WVH82440.1 HAMP domain-containing sensor histidine kinase [Lentzea sp. DG1S-22]
MPRTPGLSARLKFTLSYAGIVIVSGAVLLAVAWWYLLRYVPDNDQGLLGISPNRYLLSRIFGRAAAWAMLFLVTFGLVGGWLLAGRMLAPLTQITDAARRAAGGSLSHRIRLPGKSDEFRELADVFDTMLEKLESHVGEQRRFAANASHELRTPLAISQSLLDLARQDPSKVDAELLDRLHAASRRAIDLTEALLLLSRGERGGFPREPVDLSLVAEEVAETLLPFAERRRVSLDVTGGTARTTGSAELLQRVVTNLVQNAIVHNLPSGGTVTVHTEQQHRACVLRVENTGRHLPADVVQTLVEPFQRGGERIRADDHAGVGLGLAIVHSVVRAHDGALDVVARPEGGLRVTIRLPA